MPVIASRRHAIVKKFRDVARGHDTHALLDGWHLLHDAASAGMTIETIAVSGEAPRVGDATLLDDLVRRATVVSVTGVVMQALSPVRTSSGVVALVRRRVSQLDHVLTPYPPLALIGIDIQDPGNAGAVIRSAEAGGATGVVFAGRSADPWGWKALRAGMGSTFRLPVVHGADAESVCARLRRAGLTLFATVPGPGIAMQDADLRGPAALVFGGEGGGLTDAQTAAADLRVFIPMQTPVESLNVAVAAGVLVYEARRQRLCQA